MTKATAKNASRDAVSPSYEQALEELERLNRNAQQAVLMADEAETLGLSMPALAPEGL